MRAPLAAVLLVALPACGTSPKARFYALTPVPAEDRRETVPYRVQLAAVHLPPPLDRRQMVRMTGENRVGISDVDRWSGPLDDMVRNVLSQDLAERLPAGTLVLPEAPAPPGTRPLVVTIAQFGPDAGERVRLVGSWALVDAASDAPLLERDVRLDGGPAPTADAAAAGMSRALGALADGIASDLAAPGGAAAGFRPEPGSPARPAPAPRTRP